jgi:hypothetical protein
MPCKAQQAFHSDQLSCELRQLVDGFSPAELDYEVLAFDVAEVA